MLAALCIASALAAFPERKEGPPGWVKGSRSSPDDIVKFRFALHHDERRVGRLERQLYAISDPASAEYGKHMSRDDIIDAIAAEPRVIRTVRARCFFSLAALHLTPPHPP